MRTHTSAFKNQIKELGRELDCKITYGTTIIANEDLITIKPVLNGALLKSVMKELDFESYNNVPVGTIIKFQFGILVNGVPEYLDYGNYEIYSSEYNEDTGTYNYVCYDKMLKSMVDYENMNITYPITIRNYLSAICTKLGITFGSSSDNFANYNMQIPNELFLDSEGGSLNYTFRDVLDDLSEVTASCICIDNQDRLVVRYPNNTNDTIDGEFIKDVNVKFGEVVGPFNTIVLSRSAGSDNVYYPNPLPSNPIEFKIIDNEIMNYDNRSDYLPAIYNKLNGMSYSLNEYSSTGIMYYELLDKYDVSIENNTYHCIMLNDEPTITQGLEELIYTEKQEEEETDYEKASPDDRQKLRTEIIVNKQLGNITLRVSEAETDISNVNTRLTTEVQNLQSQIDGQIQFWNGPVIPTLSNEPAVNWTTEADKNNHRADIYTVIINDEQGKSYRFDKVNNVWKWVEITDNELSAVKAIAEGKAKVFSSQPTPPYSIGDIWWRDGLLYKATIARGEGASFQEGDFTPSALLSSEEFADTMQDYYTKQETSSEIEIAKNEISLDVERIDKNYEYLTTLNKDASGEDIELNDALESNLLDYSLDGNSHQESQVNLFDGETAQGYLDFDGEFVPVTGWVSSANFIPIDYLKKYVVNGTNMGARVLYMFYNSSQTKLGSRGETTPNTPITPVANASYFKFSTNNDNATNIIVSVEPPSPTNQQEIEVLDGYNLLSSKTRVGNQVYFNGATGQTDYVFKPGTYTFSFINNNNPSIYVKTATTSATSKGTINPLTITMNEDFNLWLYRSGMTDDEIKDVQLKKGTTPQPYLPYNNIGYRVRGKNLFDKTSTFTKPYDYWVLPINLKQNTTYTLSAMLKGTKLTNVTFAIVPSGDRYSDFSGTMKAVIDYGTGNNSTKTITTDSSWASPKLVIYASSQAIINSIYDNYDIQLEQGTTSTPYEPYKETIIPINLQGNFIGKVGTTKDLLRYQDGHLYLDKKIGKVVLDGSEESWLENAATKGLFQITLTNVSANTSKVCTMSNNLIGVTGLNIAQQSAYVNDSVATYNTNRIFFRLNEYANNLAGLKTWLSTHNTIVYYELATPYTIDLGEYQLPLYEGYNHIDILSSLCSNSSLTYQVNTILNATFVTNAQLKVNNDNITQQVTQKIMADGVDKVINTTGRFDSNGLTIQKTGADTQTNLNEDGMLIQTATGGTTLLQVDHTGMNGENIHVQEYLYVGNHARIQDFGDGFGIFYMGGN